MKTPSDTQRNAAHEEWELRLQDWMDGAADEAEARTVEQHLETCDSCTQLLAELRRLDAELTTSMPTEPGPGAQFDAKLFATIAAEEAARERVRKTAGKTASADELATLERAWRRTLARILGIAAIAIVALAWLVMSGAIGFLSPATIAVTIATLSPLQWLSIGAIGAAGSVALTRWLQSV